MTSSPKVQDCTQNECNDYSANGMTGEHRLPKGYTPNE